MSNFTYGIEFAVVAALGIAVTIYHYLDIKKDEKIIDQDAELTHDKIEKDVSALTDDELDEIISSRGSSTKPKA